MKKNNIAIINHRTDTVKMFIDRSELSKKDKKRILRIVKLANYYRCPHELKVFSLYTVDTKIDNHFYFQFDNHCKYLEQQMINFYKIRNYNEDDFYESITIEDVYRRMKMIIRTRRKIVEKMLHSFPIISMKKINNISHIPLQIVDGYGKSKKLAKLEVLLNVARVCGNGCFHIEIEKYKKNYFRAVGTAIRVKDEK